MKETLSKGRHIRDLMHLTDERSGKRAVSGGGIKGKGSLIE